MAQKKSKSAKPKPGPKQIAVHTGEMPTIVDPTLKTVWVDKTNLYVRSDTPVATVSFSTLVSPDKLIECARIQSTVTHLKATVDMICKTIDYYPAKR